MAEYAWRNITVSMLGRVLEGILDVEYEMEEEKKYQYGRGGKVKGIGRGNEKPSASITLRQSEVEAMTRAVQETDKKATLRDIVFDVQIHYVLLGGTEIVKDRIVNAQFTKITKSMKQGDSEMQVKMPMMCEDIMYNL